MTPEESSGAPASVTRADIRAMVEADSAALRECMAQGGNASQLVLDQQDRVDAMCAGYSPEERERFARIYAEELNAGMAENERKLAQITAETNARLSELAHQRAKDENYATQAGAGLATVVLFVVLFWILK